MNPIGRNLVLWVLILVLTAFLFNAFHSGSSVPSVQNIPYSTFLNQVKTGGVINVRIQGDTISGHLATGQSFTTYAPQDPGLVDRLTEADVQVEAVPPDEGAQTLFAILINWFPMLLLIGVWVFFMRQMQSGGGRAMGFGKSRAKLLNERRDRVTFEQVAGVEEAKKELQEIVEFLRSPQKFQRLGGKVPKGVLLIGPPGTGKTLIARAVAGEANVPFFSISGSDFVEMFVGVGASRVRDMFEQAKKSAPCIIFIDELDAVGRHRGAGLGGGNDEREQTLNQLLVEMDGFESNEGVILVAATNRPDVLDPALLRAGRFDRQVVVPNPDVLGREKILDVHLKQIPKAQDVESKVIARGTPGFSGADLANLVNESALLAARRNRRVVTMPDLEEAKDKVMMGPERRSMVMTLDERKLTAFHEAGHALVGYLVPGNDPVHKVTIIPRGRALGLTMGLPERDRLSYRKSEMEARLAMMYGGRIAEEIIFGADDITTGASNDIQQATNMARAMVTEYGMSEKLGSLRYRDNQEEVFLGHSVARNQHVSEKTAEMVDIEIRRICLEAEARAREVLTKERKALDLIAEALLEYETLTGADMELIIAGKKLDRTVAEEVKEAAPSASVPVSNAGKQKSKSSKIGGVPKPGLKPEDGMLPS